MSFIVETLSDKILLRMLFEKGMTRADMRLEVEAKHGTLIPDDVFNREYNGASRRASLWDKEIRRF